MAVEGNGAPRAVILGHVARAEAGIRLFPDIGSGIPTVGNTHEVAQAVALESLAVYAGNDPIVHAHANALLTGSTGMTRIVLAGLRGPHAILGHPKVTELIDFTGPAGPLLVAILHFITGAGAPPPPWPPCGTRGQPAVTPPCHASSATSGPRSVPGPKR